jgi:hypothetical protein
MMTYRSHDFKTDLLDDARTRVQHTQDELTVAQSWLLGCMAGRRATVRGPASPTRRKSWAEFGPALCDYF